VRKGDVYFNDTYTDYGLIISIPNKKYMLATSLQSACLGQCNFVYC